MAKILTLGSNLREYKLEGSFDDTFIHNNIIVSLVSSLKNDDIIVLYLDELEELEQNLGLRIGMHIRLSLQDIKEAALLPIILVSELPIQVYLNNGELSQLLLSKEGLVYCSSEDLAINKENIKPLNWNRYKSAFLDNINIRPTHGSHSIANQWGANVLGRIVLGKESLELPCMKDEMCKLYFKFTFCKTADLSLLQQKNSENKFLTKRIIKSDRKKILLIDDQSDSGWEVVLKSLLSGAIFHTISDRIKDYDSLSDSKKEMIKNGDYDLIFLDLRLNGEREESVYSPNEFSGMSVLKAIKKNNEGTQVIMFTASNKGWNMKALLEEGADGYYIKESPEYGFSNSFSNANFNALYDCIKSCLAKNYLRNIYSRTQAIKNEMGFSEEIAQEIAQKLDVSYYLLSHATKEKEFAFAYVSLFEIVEFITKIFIGQYYNGIFYFNDNKEKVMNWQDNKYRIDHDNNYASSGHFSIAQKIWAIYKQKTETGDLDLAFAQKLSVLNDKRNTFIHNLPMKGRRKQHVDIYTPEAFIELFNCVEKIIKDLYSLIIITFCNQKRK